MAEEKDSVEQIEEIEIVPSSDYEYLMCAVNAYECVDGINGMTKQEQQRIDRIKRKSIMIIDHIIGNMYDELFEEDESK